MKLYVDLNGERHFLVTDDGEAVYVDELKEEGRDTEYLDHAIKQAMRHRVASRMARATGSIDVETFGPETEEQHAS
ncbi:MAG TPA: hypothetical protein VHS28_02765 [Chloroflexota bacterium]|nr:hypothetical protein [Chloroflexota bacterium]